MKRASGRRRPRAAAGERLLFASVAWFMGVCVLFGGAATGPGLSFLLIGLSGTWLAALVVGGVGDAAWPHQPWIARAALVALIALPAAQLVPLPPDWWRGLAGRELAAAVLDASGQGQAWRPFSLAAGETLLTLLCACWFTALAAAVLRLRSEAVSRLLILILALAAVQVAIGSIQFLSRGATLDVHGSAHRGSLLGFFANKNHIGLFLAASLLFGVALTPEQGPTRRRALALMIPSAVLVMAAIAATYSRAGLLLGLSAIALAALIDGVGQVGRGEPRAVRFGLGALAAAGVLAALATTNTARDALARFASVNEDLRWLFWAGGRPLAEGFWPWGGGFGVFTDAFAAGERLEWVKPTYVNHAHNDYLELVIEAGLPGLVALGLVAAACARAGMEAWRRRWTPEARRALVGLGVIALFAAHSVADYPIRRPGLAVIFFFAMGLCLRVFRPQPRGSGSMGRTGRR